MGERPFNEDSNTCIPPATYGRSLGIRPHTHPRALGKCRPRILILRGKADPTLCLGKGSVLEAAARVNSGTNVAASTVTPPSRPQLDFGRILMAGTIVEGQQTRVFNLACASQLWYSQGSEAHPLSLHESTNPSCRWIE